MDRLIELEQEFKTELSKYNLKGSPVQLYNPIEYILQLGGKRIRPLMVLAAYRLFNNNSNPRAVKLALAIELFHNFSLLHDDIMDHSNLRRGQETVHIKWDEPTAILSGDLMLIKVYQILAELGETSIITSFSAMATELCEGQMMDMQFETMNSVSLDDYLLMIEKKTAVLLAFSLKQGAILAEADEESAKNLYQMGIHLGLAFQLMDDYLDSFGEKAAVGKRIGGDILEGKKTFLWLAMIAKLKETDRITLNHVKKQMNEDDYIKHVKNLMITTGAKESAHQKAREHHQKALELFNAVNTEGERKYIETIFKVLEDRSA